MALSQRLISRDFLPWGKVQTENNFNNEKHIHQKNRSTFLFVTQTIREQNGTALKDPWVNSVETAACIWEVHSAMHVLCNETGKTLQKRQAGGWKVA